MSVETTAPASETATPVRTAHHRHYLMCKPSHFTVNYSINPWMEPAKPTDTARAVEQWQKLHDLYLELGHEVELIEPLAGYPDMVYTANGGFLIDGRAYVPKFRFVERQGEAPRSRTGSAVPATTPCSPKRSTRARVTSCSSAM